MKVHILILNYNGRDLIEKYLPSIMEAADASKHDCKVVVVDNLSTDGSIESIKKNFPSCGVFVAKDNKVLCSYNDVLKGIDSDLVILLNNDMKVERDFVDFLVEHFEDGDSVFFVAPRILNLDGSYNGGKSFLVFERGAIKNVVDYGDGEKPGQTHSISTGAFRRDLFLKLGGFDDLYLPGIWEDVDICFRGLVRGFKGIYEPRSLIWHDESTTFHRVYGRRRKMMIAHRNMFLFIWKNITDGSILLRHFLLTPLRILVQALLGRPEVAQGFFLALGRLPVVMEKRAQIKRDNASKVLKDGDLIKTRIKRILKNTD